MKSTKPVHKYERAEYNRRMNRKSDKNTLAELAKSHREQQALSFGELSAASGLPKSVLFAIEAGNVAHPAPITLQKLARGLQAPVADFYAAAGYEAPDLPTITPYLRSRYKDLPPAAQDEIASAFERISKKYGIDPARSGPDPGQDE